MRGKNMSRTNISKNVLSFFLRIIISAGLLWFLSTKIDIPKTVAVLQSADPKFILVAALLFSVCNVVLYYRWIFFIKALDLSVSRFDVLRYYCAGLFGNLFLPSAIGGDAIKIIGLCHNSTQKPRVVASVLLDRLSGFASIVIISTGGLAVGYHYFHDRVLLMLIGLIAVVSLLVAVFLFNEKIYSFGCRIFDRLPKVKSSLMTMHYDIALLRNRKKEGMFALGLSCTSQLIFSFVWVFLARGLHQDLSVVYFPVLVPLSNIAAAVPSIGGLGAREAGVALLFTRVGMGSGVAVSMSLMNFLLMVLAGLIGGGIYVLTLSSGRVQYHSSDASALRGPAET